MQRVRRVLPILTAVFVLLVIGLGGWLAGDALLAAASSITEGVATYPLVSALVATGALWLWSMLLPTAVPIMVMGYVFGLGLGIGLTMVATTTAYVAAYAVGRVCPPSWLEWLQRYRWWTWVERGVQGHSPRELLVFVMLMRLSPIVPFQLQNYVYGMLRVAFVPVTLGTLLGKTPHVIATVWVGVLVRSGVSDWQDGAGGWQVVLMAAAIVATFGAVALVSRAAKRSLRTE